MIFFDFTGHDTANAWHLRANNTAPNNLGELRKQFGDVFGVKFEQCFQKCLSVNPDDRHTSAQEFLKEIFQIYDEYLVSKQIHPPSGRQ